MMEQFEKWLRHAKHANFTWEEDAKDAWRAALKEVLKQLNDIYSSDFENSEIVKWIEQELGDT